MAAQTIAELSSQDSFAFSPSSAETCVERAFLDAEDLQPVLEDVGGAIDLDVAAVSAVPVLSHAESPDAIARAVPGVVVEPLDGVLVGGASAHVGQEALVHQPPFADRDATTTVVLPGRVLRVGAALEHPAPDVVFGRPVFVPTVVPVDEGFCPDRLQVQAPAGTGEPKREAVSLNVSRFSAVAGTSPPRSTTPGREARGGCEALELVAGFDDPCTPATCAVPLTQTPGENLSFDTADTTTQPSNTSFSSGSLCKDSPMAKVLTHQIKDFRHPGVLHERREEWQAL